MIQSTNPSLFISNYNPLRFVESSLFAQCGELNPSKTLYHNYNKQVQTEVQQYAQPYSYKDRLVTHFYSKYNTNRVKLLDVCSNTVIDTFELSPLPNQVLYTISSNLSAVQITNDSLIAQNTFIRLTTGILDGIVVNGTSNAWTVGIGRSLVGSQIRVTVDNKLIEATVMDYQNQNFDWLELDRLIDLTSFSSVDVTIEVIKRVDLAYYYQSSIDLCDYPESVYQLVLEVENLEGFDSETYEKNVLPVSRTIESEYFDLRKDQMHTNLIKYKNNFSELEIQEVDWTVFNSLDYFEFRVHSQFLPTSNQSQKNNIFRATNNIQIISDQSTNNGYKLKVDYVPWYIHQKLSVITNCDYILVNDMSVIASEAYKSEELLRIGKSTGSIVLSQQNNFMENLS